MINKKLFLKIYLYILLIFVLFVIIFFLLGTIKRTGYLSNFNIEDINSTLELNGLNIEETKKLFTVDNVLDNNALTNYIFTNEAITNYSYNFRVLYYSKVFRNSDLYGVYIDIDKTINDNSFIREIKINKKGSPFATLISDKKLDYNEKIDNISYTLLLKFKFILFIFAVFLIIWIVYFIVNKIELNMLKLFFIEKKKYIFITYISLIIIFILFFVINSSIRRKSNLTDLQLIAESEVGYVYKAKVEKSYKYSPFYINNNSIILNNTNNIKYYGYSLQITNKPVGSWYDNNDTFYTDNSTFIVNNEYKTNGYFYNIQVPTYIGDKYKITIFASQLGSNRNMFWYLNEFNDYKEITKKEVSNDQIILSDIRNIFYKAYGNFYLMFPQGLTEVKSILIESLNTSINSEDGYTIFTTESKIDNGQTLEINYKLKNKFSLNVLILLLLTLPTLFYMYCLLGKLKSNKLFSAFAFMIGIILFAFQFWLCFPGYYNYPDGYYIMTEAINNVYTNWHPFIIGLTLHILYKIFGYHTFYIFFINLFLWYVGLFLIIISLYYKFKNRLVILLFALSFLANIFFANITHLKDITATLFFFFGVSILIFQMLVDIKNKVLNILINILMYISLIFALLWRHNFIVTIYPIFIVIVYRYLKNIDNKKYFLLKFCSIILIIAFVLIAIVKISPIFIAKPDNKYEYPPAIIILYHISGCAVPANDGSLIPDEWYIKNKNFEDLKQLYYKNNKISLVYITLSNDRVFRNLTYDDKIKLQEVFIKYVLKYPLNYIKHIINYSIEFITNTYIYIPVDQNSIQGYDYGRTDTYKKVFGDQRGIVFDTIRYNVYSFLYVNKIYLTIFYFVILSIVLFFITGYIWLFKSNLRNSFLLLSFSLAFSAVATIIIVCLFTPVPIYRYIYPVVIISILSLILFIIHKFDITKINEIY